jgi:hypothetical protein
MWCDVDLRRRLCKGAESRKIIQKLLCIPAYDMNSRVLSGDYEYAALFQCAHLGCSSMNRTWGDYRWQGAADDVACAQHAPRASRRILAKAASTSSSRELTDVTDLTRVNNVGRNVDGRKKYSWCCSTLLAGS